MTRSARPPLLQGAAVALFGFCSPALVNFPVPGNRFICSKNTFFCVLQAV